MSEGVAVGAPSAAGTDGGSAASADQSTTTETTDGSEYDPSNPPPIDPGFGDDIDDTGEPGDTGERFTLTVNGKPVEVTLEEMKSHARQNIAAGNKLEVLKQQQAELQGQQALVDKQKGAVKQLIQVLSTGDIDTIAEFMEDRMNAGDAFKKGIIQYCMRLYEDSKMSPEQREAVQSKKELTKMRAANAEREKQDSERRWQYEVNKWTEHVNTEVPKALKELGLPDSPFVISRIRTVWTDALNRGQTPTAMAVASHVKKEMVEANLLHAPQATPAKMARPRATPASVGMKNGKAESQYISMEDLQRSRGR